MEWITIFFLLLTAFLLLQIGRVTIVYHYRLKMLDILRLHSKLDILEGKDFNGEWYDKIHEVSYEEMVWKSWRKVDSFYDHENLFKQYDERLTQMFLEK